MYGIVETKTFDNFYP